MKQTLILTKDCLHETRKELNHCKFTIASFSSQMYQSITERALKNMGKVPREELLEEIVKLKGEVEELKEKILEL